MARPANARALLVAAVAGLALGGAVFAFSRAGDAPDRPAPAPTSSAPLVPSSLPSGPGPESSLPPESTAEQGATFYAVFLAIATEADDPELLAAQRRAEALGYSGGVADIGCTVGAREQLRLSPSGTFTAYSIFFASQERADRFVQAYGAPVAGTARITATCLD